MTAFLVPFPLRNTISGLHATTQVVWRLGAIIVPHKLDDDYIRPQCKTRVYLFIFYPHLTTLYPWPRLTPTSAAMHYGNVQVENHWYCAYIGFVGSELVSALSQAHFHKNKRTITSALPQEQALYHKGTSTRTSALSQAHFHKNKQGYPHTCPCAATGRERRTPSR
jgi:hypothetical protein